MPFTVVNGATLMCSFGMAPSTFVVTPVNGAYAEHQPVANILDHKPMLNVMPFGMCMSLANPQVSAATTAASGVLTPQPCIPQTISPWTPGVPDVLLAGSPIIDNTCTCNCIWAGVVSITNPGQFSVIVP